MKDYLQCSMEEYPTLYKSELDVIEHLLCVIGNGVSARTFGPKELVTVESEDCEPYVYQLGGYCLDANAISQYKVIPLRTLYPWLSTEANQPFRKYLQVTDETNKEGFKEAVRYFLKCLEISTVDHMIEANKEYYAFEIPEQDLEMFANDLKNWKENAHILKEVFEV